MKMKSLVNLLASLQGLDASSFTNETERVQARDALFEALRRIQSPWDIAWDHCWVSPAVSACVKTLIDVRVFQKWAEAGHGPITCPQLAELTGADGLLLQRMMRCLAGQHLVVETAADTYLPTPWARNFASHAAFKGCYGGLLGELTSPLSCVLPEFLEHSKYKNPVDSAQGAFQYWQGADTSLFTWAGQNERFRVDFNDAMECHSQYNLTPWTEVYPTDTIIADGKAKPDRKLVLDIGGGKGHDLLKFLGRHAEECPEGSLVLQDLPDILKGVRFESKAIEIQPHDFFTEQPVKGARAYFMHNVIQYVSSTPNDRTFHFPRPFEIDSESVVLVEFC